MKLEQIGIYSALIEAITTLTEMTTLCIWYSVKIYYGKVEPSQFLFNQFTAAVLGLFFFLLFNYVYFASTFVSCIKKKMYLPYNPWAVTAVFFLRQFAFSKVIVMGCKDCDYRRPFLVFELTTILYLFYVHYVIKTYKNLLARGPVAAFPHGNIACGA